jgi:cytochrome c oxidase assembly protein subunit 15
VRCLLGGTRGARKEDVPAVSSRPHWSHLRRPPTGRARPTTAPRPQQNAGGLLRLRSRPSPAGTVPALPRDLRGARRYGGALRALTAATLTACYLLVVLGDTVRVTESGMGCRSWPLCNGQAGLTGTMHAVLEQSHRYLAAIVTVLVTAVFVTAWRRARRDRVVLGGATAALALLGLQILLGAITVFTHNAGWTVALHLAGAWLVTAAVTVTAAGVWRASGATPSGLAPTRAALAGRPGFAATVALFVLAVTGMLVLHGGASRACPGWPGCGRSAADGGLVALQYLHRSFALLAGVMVVAAAVAAWRSQSAGRAGRLLAASAVALLAAAAAAGAIVAVSNAIPAAQDVHLAVASALWIVVVALATPAGTLP